MFFPWHMDVFSGISDREKEEILRLPWREREFRKKEVILRAGSEYTSLGILTSGECQALFPSWDEAPRVVEVLKSPTMIASAIVFASEPVLPVHVEAITDGRWISVDKREWERCLGICETLRRNFLREVSDKLVVLSRRIQLLQLPVEKRLLHYLAWCARHRREVVLSMTIEQLAQYLFVTRQALCRIFRRLEEKGYFVQKRRRFVLLDRFVHEYLEE